MKLSAEDLKVISNAAIKEYNKTHEITKKKSHDYKLHNIKLLLKNYRRLKAYCDNIDATMDGMESAVRMLNDRAMSVESIRISTARTAIMMKYFDAVLAGYKSICEQGDNDDRRRYSIISALYLEANRNTADKISELHFCSKRTLYYEVDKGCEQLRILAFGIDGLNDLKRL